MAFPSYVKISFSFGNYPEYVKGRDYFKPRVCLWLKLVLCQICPLGLRGDISLTLALCSETRNSSWPPSQLQAGVQEGPHGERGRRKTTTFALKESSSLNSICKNWYSSAISVISSFCKLTGCSIFLPWSYFRQNKPPGQHQSWDSSSATYQIDLRWPGSAAAWSRISVPRPEIEARPQQWEPWILTTRPWGPVASDKALACLLCRNEFQQRDGK